jgi:homoaconitase/3-isopropylmalate dehydratase large subunit
VVVVVRLDTQEMGGMVLAGTLMGQALTIIGLPNRVKVVVVEVVLGSRTNLRIMLVQQLVVVVLGYMAKVQMVLVVLPI